MKGDIASEPDGSQNTPIRDAGIIYRSLRRPNFLEQSVKGDVSETFQNHPNREPKLSKLEGGN